MKITIESTGTLTEIQGARCRLWEGVTERGAKVWVFVRLISASADEDTADLDAELEELTGTPEAFLTFRELHS